MIERYFNITRTYRMVTELFRRNMPESDAIAEKKFWESRARQGDWIDGADKEVYELIEVPVELTPPVFDARLSKAGRIQSQSARWVELAKLAAERQAFDDGCGITFGEDRDG